MIMEILTGNGGDSVLFARYTGGILSSSTKKSGGGGILSGGDFVLHSFSSTMHSLTSLYFSVYSGEFLSTSKMEIRTRLSSSGSSVSLLLVTLGVGGGAQGYSELLL